jgi:hypothetical protein
MTGVHRCAALRCSESAAEREVVACGLDVSAKTSGIEILAPPDRALSDRSLVVSLELPSYASLPVVDGRVKARPAIPAIESLGRVSAHTKALLDD